MAIEGVDIQEITVNALWNWVFFIVSTISNIILNILYTNLLGPELYGEYKIIIMIYSLINLSTTFISGLAIIKYTSVKENQKSGLDKDYFKVAFTFLMALKFGVFLSYIIFANILFSSIYSQHLIFNSKIYFIYILIEPINYIFTAYNISLYKIRRTFIISSLNPILSLIFSVIAFYFIGISVINLIYAILLANLIVFFLFVYIMIRDKLITRFKPTDFKLFKQLFLYSLPFYVSAAIFQIVNWIDVFFISIYSPINPEYYVGIYSVARSTFFLIIGLTDSIITVLAPAFVNIYHNGNLEDLQKSIDKSTKYVIIIATFFSAIFITLVPILFMLIYPGYEQSIFILQIFLLELPIGCIGRMLSQLISASNKKILYKSLQIPIFQAILSIILIYIFMFSLNMGIYGAVLSVLLARIIGSFYEMVFMKKIMKIKVKFKYYIRPLIAGLLTTALFLGFFYFFNVLASYQQLNILFKSISFLIYSVVYIFIFSIILITSRTFDNYDYINLKRFCEKNKILLFFGKPLIYILGKFVKNKESI
ncbi:MAG: oligosaccharide flippase family protein [Candidatus Helarchaeota archaeon]